MQKLFSLDSPFMQALSRFADLIILSVLWVVCSIPLFTAGAATTALYAVLFKNAEVDTVPVLKTFFQKFKENFKQATILWLIILPFVLLVAADVYLILMGVMGTAPIVKIACAIPAVVLIMAMGYPYPMIAYFNVTTKQTLKNAIYLSLGKLPKSFLIAVVNCLPIIAILFLPRNILLASAIF